MSEQKTAIVYFDGGCPLCRSEIAHYQRQDKNDRIAFVDVSPIDVELGDGLTREQAMSRLHLRSSDGTMRSGAAAFVAIWELLPNWRWAARIAQMPGAIHALEFCYRAFLPVRPVLSRFFGKISISCAAPSTQKKHNSG
jgi:predicted DCC family thiol-disulfide oxidoreductase YuxK